MKIGYLCSDIEIEVFGHHGCSVHLREFSNARVEAGHEVFIVCARAGDGNRATTKAPVHEVGVDALAWNLIRREPVIREHHLERDLWSTLWKYEKATWGAASSSSGRAGDVKRGAYFLIPECPADVDSLWRVSQPLDPGSSHWTRQRERRNLTSFTYRNSGNWRTPASSSSAIGAVGASIVST
jgi:hypothetical protein